MPIHLFFFVVGIILFLTKPKYVPLYYVLWPTMFDFFIDLFFPIKYEEYVNAGAVYSRDYIWFCSLLLIIFVFDTFKTKDRRTIYALGLFVVYITILGLSRGSLREFQGWVRGYICFIPLWILMKYRNISFIEYKKYIYFALILEISVSIIQLMTDFYPTFSNGHFAENGTRNIVGTFARYNAL